MLPVDSCPHAEMRWSGRFGARGCVPSGTLRWLAMGLNRQVRVERSIACSVRRVLHRARRAGAHRSRKPHEYRYCRGMRERGVRERGVKERGVRERGASRTQGEASMKRRCGKVGLWEGGWAVG